MKTGGQQRGFTLTEVTIVLGIIGLIIAAIWSASRSSYETQRQTRFSQELLNLQGAVAQYGTQLDSSNLITSFNSVNAFPLDLGADSPWQTKHVTAGGSSPMVGFIAFGMPTSSCVQAYLRNCGVGTSLYCGMINLTNAQAAQPPQPITGPLTAGQCTDIGNGQSQFWILFLL